MQSQNNDVSRGDRAEGRSAILGGRLHPRRLRRPAGARLRLGNQILKFLAADRLEAECFETIYKLMTTDGLTGAVNKRHFLETLDRELVRSHRTGRPLVLVL